MTNIVTLDFKHAQPINLDDQVNLRDIFNVLVDRGGLSANTKYTHWATRKLEYYTETIDYFTSAKKSTRNRSRGASTEVSHTCSIQVAMEIIANGHKEAGYEMRRFMTECIRLAQNQLASPNLSEIDILVRSVGLLAKQQQEIDTLKRDTPKIVKKEVELVLEDKQAFPEDCMRLSEISSHLFPGVATQKVSAYLHGIRHPRGNHVRIDEYGNRIVSHPFKSDGLEDAAKNFFDELTLLKETPKCYFWYHPKVGTMRKDKSLAVVG